MWNDNAPSYILEKAIVINRNQLDIKFMCEGCLKFIERGEMMRRLENSAHYSHDNDECFNKMIENIDKRV